MPSVSIRLLSAFALLMAAVFATGWLVYQQHRSTAWVEHTLLAEGRISQLFGSLLDTENGQRSFLLTSEPIYLERFYTDLATIEPQLDQLAKTVSDNPEQMANLARLRPLMIVRRDLMHETVELARNGSASGALARFREGREKARLVDIRDLVTAMIDEEGKLLTQREATASKGAWLAGGGLLVSGGLILVLAGLSYLELRRRVRELRVARDELSVTVAMLRTEGKVRQSAEAQVRQLQKMEAVGKLTGGIAHDFNNMLAVIIGGLELARRRLDSDRAKAIGYIDSAAEGAKRAAQLTARLLAFSRQQALDPRPLDVNKLVADMSELLRRTLGENIHLEAVLAGGLWTSFADPAQLENVVLNLCVNAKDAMPEGGRLTVETANTSLDDAYASAQNEVTAGQYVCIAVTDTGTGMPPEVMERAFDPFYTTKSVGRGTGLGLSQVYGFVKQSAGHVKIYSEPNHGTTVKVYLPRHFGEQLPVHLETKVDEIPKATDDETILVVEDERSVRQLSADALRELGYKVVQAANADEALTMLTLHPSVDLIFTDIVMPGRNGRQLADAARKRWPHLKVLYTTGYTRNAIIHNGILDHGVALLPKPFTVPQLARRIRQVLDAR